MSLYPDYCTKAEVKALLGITDTVDDTAIDLAITAASRAIDGWCLRQFGSATAQTREYPITGRTVAIEDVTSVTSVAVRPEWDTTETALTSGTDYRLGPRNAAHKAQPYTSVTLANDYTDSVLKVTGTVGWTAVPAAVKQACQIQAIRFFKRPLSPFGVAGSPDVGSELRLQAKVDPDVQVLLQRYRRVWGAV